MLGRACMCVCVYAVATAKSADAKYQGMHAFPNAIKDLWPNSERKGSVSLCLAPPFGNVQYCTINPTNTRQSKPQWHKNILGPSRE